MIVIPAIDIKGGRVVRLVEGRADTETAFGDDPAIWARRWASEGAEWIHVVDLDGAFEGAPRNLPQVRAVVEAVTAGIEFGGGVRDTSVVEALVGAGVARIVIGSAIVENRPWVEEMLARFPGRIAVGIDASGGMVAIHGWTTVTEIPALDLGRECEGLGAAAIIYTDIARDGRMAGANVDAMRAMVEAVKVP